MSGSSPPVVLRLDKVSKHFGRIAAVNELSFEVFEGDIFGFLGPNGAGKSTTFYMISGLVAPSGGRIEIFGRPPHDPRRALPRDDRSQGEQEHRHEGDVHAVALTFGEPLDWLGFGVWLSMLLQARGQDVRPLAPILERKARVGDRYGNLLRRFKVADDVKDYSLFAEIGYFDAYPIYKGHKDIPPGFWVYAYPYWYVWERSNRSGKDELWRELPAEAKYLVLNSERIIATGYLAITRRYCQLMGGEIDVASEPGKGSTFSMRLPAEVSDPRAEPTRA